MAGIIGNGTTVKLYDTAGTGGAEVSAGELIGVSTVMGSTAESVDTTTQTDLTSAGGGIRTFARGSSSPGTMVFDVAFDPQVNSLAEGETAPVKRAEIDWNDNSKWVFDCFVTDQSSSGMNIDEMGTTAITLQRQGAITITP